MSGKIIMPYALANWIATCKSYSFNGTRPYLTALDDLACFSLPSCYLASSLAKNGEWQWMRNFFVIRFNSTKRPPPSTPQWGNRSESKQHIWAWQSKHSNKRCMWVLWMSPGLLLTHQELRWIPHILNSLTLNECNHEWQFVFCFYFQSPWQLYRNGRRESLV